MCFWIFKNDYFRRAQLLLPAHVVNEYCRPDRSFSPCPDFSKPEPNDAWRIRTIDEGEWFTAQYNGGGLGSGFGVCRGGDRRARAGDNSFYAAADHQAVVTLFSTRQKQRDALLSDLVRDRAPFKAAMNGQLPEQAVDQPTKARLMLAGSDSKAG